ncbi:MAG: hypothetical protein HUJ54_05835 [Erysipelotrichaceae bacterium]|nr:hypothetical protein [Erysipelotrichaceae bacterium]
MATADAQTNLLEERGLGTVIPYDDITELHPGDIFNNGDHIYILVQVYEDGSRLILHAAPPGVQFSGTPSASGVLNSTAAQEAAKIMSEHYPEYYAKYPDTTTDASYNFFDQFVWSPEILPDTETVDQMDGDAFLASIFS